MAERDYVLGTDKDELDRLGIQHRVWRPRMLDGWRRAGITVGQTVLDIGAGPGYASIDLAEIVGPSGKVIAVERSRRFLQALGEQAERLGLRNIEMLERDVVEDEFGEGEADAVWCRWLLCFLSEPERAVANVARALKPGGVAIFHEYADYGTWQMMPPDADLDRFRELVIKSWRESGGEPDAGLRLPSWLAEAGFEVTDVKPMIAIIDPEDFRWQWPAAFLKVNAWRQHELGYASEEEADRFARLLDDPPPNTRMITPLVSEVIARRR